MKMRKSQLNAEQIIGNLPLAAAGIRCLLPHLL
jgi:hypothetical protein